jgi:hypothetical protein
MSILILCHRIGSGQRGLPWIMQPSIIWIMTALITAFTIAMSAVSMAVEDFQRFTDDMLTSQDGNIFLHADLEGMGCSDASAGVYIHRSVPHRPGLDQRLHRSDIVGISDAAASLGQGRDKTTS